MTAAMTPAGYLSKRVVPPLGWLEAATDRVATVCSVADCVNDNVVDVQGLWQHNGFGLANDPSTLRGVDGLAAGELFYFEAYPFELDSDGWSFDRTDWQPRTPLRSAMVPDDVVAPTGDAIKCLGYDVVVSVDFIEHSPLSCNGMAATLAINAYCLFDRLSDAIKAIENGAFEGCEDGRYGVYAVYRCQQL